MEIRQYIGTVIDRYRILGRRYNKIILYKGTIKFKQHLKKKNWEIFISKIN